MGSKYGRLTYEQGRDLKAISEYFGDRWFTSWSLWGHLAIRRYDWLCNRFLALGYLETKTLYQGEILRRAIMAGEDVYSFRLTEKGKKKVRELYGKNQ